jgi:hypothetical protein
MRARPLLDRLQCAMPKAPLMCGTSPPPSSALSSAEPVLSWRHCEKAAQGWQAGQPEQNVGLAGSHGR